MIILCDVQPLRIVYVEQVMQELIDYVEQVGGVWVHWRMLLFCAY
jgi:hypothetical protein